VVQTEDESKKIVMRLDANHQKGMGHLFRMVVLASCFVKSGIQCHFVVRENGVTREILEKHSCSAVYFPENQSEVGIISDFCQQHFYPDLWIFDVLNTEVKWLRKLKSNNIPVVCFDDLHAGVQGADLVINGIAGCWEPVVTGKNILSGPQYVIIPPSVLEIKKLTGTSYSVPRKIGVSLGGSDTHGATIKIADLLSSIEGYRVTFFLGPHFSHDKLLKEVLKTVPYDYIIRRGVDDLHREIAQMDIVICNGGQTLFELCAMGMVVLALANETHEVKTISYFESKQACIDIGNIKRQINTKRVTEFMQRAKVDKDLCVSLARNAQRLVNGEGIHKIITACCKLLKACP
jgi:spore coat polysaccharide biosynthesis predicted glycosyltransferase SpsG